LRRVPGRETYAVDGGEGVSWVVKRYSGRSRRGARQELVALEALGEAGLRVPRPLGYLEGDGVAVVAMERIASTRSVREALAEPSRAERERLISELLELVLALHLGGWHHRDLYLHHVLIDSSGELVLIDLQRARRPRWLRRRWLAKDLAALLLWTPSEVDAEQRLRFLARYMDRMGILARGARRRFAADVLRRRARMARHEPRHGEEGEWEAGA